MKAYKIEFNIDGQTKHSFGEFESAKAAEKSVSIAVIEQGENGNGYHATEIEFKEDLNSKSWAVEPIGLIKARKLIHEEEQAIELTVDSDAIPPGMGAATTITFKEGVSENEAWEHLGIRAAIDIAVQLIDHAVAKYEEDPFRAMLSAISAEMNN